MAAADVAGNRINRYIMECKFGICSWFSNNNARINRYIMECKSLEDVIEQTGTTN